MANTRGRKIRTRKQRGSALPIEKTVILEFKGIDNGLHEKFLYWVKRELGDAKIPFSLINYDWLRKRLYIKTSFKSMNGIRDVFKKPANPFADAEHDIVNYTFKFITEINDNENPTKLFRTGISTDPHAENPKNTNTNEPSEDPTGGKRKTKLSRRKRRRL